ncbi:MAG: hypothetical protein GC181_15365 [Bacteroidetes bacterium]|nr:hypothetical protein [Bacteroidota bacterium]
MSNQKILVDFSYDPGIKHPDSTFDVYYSFLEKNYPSTKYLNLVNDKFYTSAVVKASNFLQEELHNLDKREVEFCWLLNHFSFEYTSEVLYLFILKELRILFPKTSITVIPSSRKCLALIHEENKNQNNPFLIHSDNSIPIKSRPFWIAINISFLLGFLLKIIRIRSRNILELKDKWLLFSARNALVKRKNAWCDTYIYHLESRLEKGHLNYKKTTLETDSESFGLTSIFSYASKVSAIKTCLGCIGKYIKTARKLPALFQLEDRTFLNRIARVTLLKNILHSSNSAGVLSYSDFYIQGRIIFNAANHTKTPTVAFQHALYDTHHLTTYFSGFYDLKQDIFPNYYMIYGPYSRKIFCDYGFPDNKMFEVGFDRMPDFEINAVTKMRSVVFLGVGHNYDVAFEYLYKNKDQLGIEKLIYRPHPRERKSNSELINAFPSIVISDPDVISLEETLNEVNHVIGFYSTSMLTALGMHKNVIMYLPHEFMQVGFSSYFGLQVVDKLENINWDLNKINYNLVEKEIHGSNRDIELLKKWGSI